MGFEIKKRMPLKNRLTGKIWIVVCKSGSSWKIHLLNRAKETHTLVPTVIQKHFEPAL